MSGLLPMLAELDESDQILLKSLGRSGSSQTEAIFGAIALVTLLSIAFVYIFRKRILRRRKRHHHHHSAPKVSVPAQPAPVAETGKRRKRWRRSGHPRRPLNPTLAETHGLPPLRQEGAPPPVPPP